MAKHRLEEQRGFSWFGRRRRDDLLERALRECGDCGRRVHVWADACRHCGAALELLAG
jgi:predicted amidophosphoribosyltransferase